MTFLISPLGTALMLLALGLCLGRSQAAGAKPSKHHRFGKTSIAAAGLWLLVWSTPATSQWLPQMLEADFPPLPLAQVPTADAIVVLGGAISPATASNPYPNLHEAADRIWHAARLYHAGKAPLLVLSGGSNPAISSTSEAQAMASLLLDLGVPASALVLEGKSRNTQENAAFIVQLLREKRASKALLVTSAVHMHRALPIVRSKMQNVVPVAIDQSSSLPFSIAAAWLPSAEVLAASGRAIKEVVGRAATKAPG